MIKYEKLGDDVEFAQLKDEYAEAIDIFPALHKYKSEHTTMNLQKLCVEISEFCRSVYASTQNDSEREIYKSLLKGLTNF